MPRPKQWTETGPIDGIATVKLSNWRWFGDYITKELLDYTTFVYRGHASSNWKLEPTLDRILRGQGVWSSAQARRDHLERFKFAARGRRGNNPQELKSDNEWWALGQHFGLATPLLDWTEVPFIALYFALASKDSDGAPSRAVYAVSRNSLNQKSKELSEEAAKAPKKEITLRDGKKIQIGKIAQKVDVVLPSTEDNARLVSQRGLFTRAPNGVRLEEWVRLNFKDSKTYVLIKIEIPNDKRHEALRYLNRMNINHLSLFPDLYGAGIYANKSLEIPKY